MPVSFYPHDEDVQVGSVQDRLEILMEAAERYRGSVLDTTSPAALAAAAAASAADAEAAKEEPGGGGKKRLTPRDIRVAFNWQEIARILREIREMPESNQANKVTKGERLKRLADIYEVLRAAKMPKLEAVRIALMNEAKQLHSGGTSTS